MGQKTHPYALRVGYIYNWKSRWFSKADYIKFLHEDLKIRKFVKEKWGFAGVADVEIERSGRKVRVTIHTARPGILIGRRGSEIDRIREEIQNLTESEIHVDIKEIKLPQVNAQLVAENIAQQLEKRVSFRKAMKKSVQLAMNKGALGIKVMCAGRLGGAEIARTEGYKEGSVPLGTFRADVDYGFTEAFTTYGTIGIKIWIYKGVILVKKEEAERTKQSEVKHHTAEEAPVEETKPDVVPEASVETTEDSKKKDAPAEETPGPDKKESENVSDAEQG